MRIWPRWMYVTQGVFLLFVAGVALASAFRDEQPFFALCALGITALGVRCISVRVTADASGLRIANPLWSHRLLWAEIRSLDLEKMTRGNLGLGLGGDVVVCKTRRGWIPISATHAGEETWRDDLESFRPTPSA